MLKYMPLLKEVLQIGDDLTTIQLLNPISTLLLMCTISEPFQNHLFINILLAIYLVVFF